MFAEELLHFVPCGDAGTLLAEGVWAGALEDTDIVPQALEYNTVEKTCQGSTNLDNHLGWTDMKSAYE